MYCYWNDKRRASSVWFRMGMLLLNSSFIPFMNDAESCLFFFRKEFWVMSNILQQRAMFEIAKDKYEPKIPDNLSKEGKNFLQRCLKRVPADRPSASALLDDPFIREKDNTTLDLKICASSEPSNTAGFWTTTTRSTVMEGGGGVFISAGSFHPPAMPNSSWTPTLPVEDKPVVLYITTLLGWSTYTGIVKWENNAGLTHTPAVLRDWTLLVWTTRRQCCDREHCRFGTRVDSVMCINTAGLQLNLTMMGPALKSNSVVVV